jgi:hypothetical protein
MTYCVDCTIRDLSETGALVSTTAPERVPSKVFLWQKETGVLFECEVRWQKAERLFGLRFVDVCGRTQRRALIERFALAGQRHAPANYGARGQNLGQRSIVETRSTQTVFHLASAAK